MGGPGQGAQVYFTDKSGSNVAYVNTSGRVLVDAIINGTLNVANIDVSGESIYLVSGQNLVQISGQTIAFSNTQIISKVSGEMVNTSGQIVYISASGLSPGHVHAATVTDQSASRPILWTAGFMMGWDNSNNSWNRVRLTELASYDAYRLKVDSVQAGSTVQTAPLVECTSLSGGTPIGSVRTTHGIVIKNLSGNADVYVAGIGTNAPFSGKGFLLSAGQEREFRVQSASGVKVFATTSGNLISWYGIDY